MNRRHATRIAAILGLAAVLGLLAVVRTTHLGAATQSATNVQITAQERRLTAAEAALRHTLAQRQKAAASSHAAPRTVYVRPAPIIVHLHPHGDDSGEHDD